MQPVGGLFPTYHSVSGQKHTVKKKKTRGFLENNFYKLIAARAHCHQPWYAK